MQPCIVTWEFSDDSDIPTKWKKEKNPLLLGSVYDTSKSALENRLKYLTTVEWQKQFGKYWKDSLAELIHIVYISPEGDRVSIICQDDWSYFFQTVGGRKKLFCSVRNVLPTKYARRVFQSDLAILDPAGHDSKVSPQAFTVNEKENKLIAACTTAFGDTIVKKLSFAVGHITCVCGAKVSMWKHKPHKIDSFNRHVIRCQQFKTKLKELAPSHYRILLEKRKVSLMKSRKNKQNFLKKNKEKKQEGDRDMVLGMQAFLLPSTKRPTACIRTRSKAPRTPSSSTVASSSSTIEMSSKCQVSPQKTTNLDKDISTICNPDIQLREVSYVAAPTSVSVFIGHTDAHGFCRASRNTHSFLLKVKSQREILNCVSGTSYVHQQLVFLIPKEIDPYQVESRALSLLNNEIFISSDAGNDTALKVLVPCMKLECSGDESIKREKLVILCLSKNVSLRTIEELVPAISTILTGSKSCCPSFGRRSVNTAAMHGLYRRDIQFLINSYGKPMAIMHDSAPTKSSNSDEHVEHFTVTWQEESIENHIRIPILRQHVLCASLTLMTNRSSSVHMLNGALKMFGDLVDFLIKIGALPDQAYFNKHRFCCSHSDRGGALKDSIPTLEIFEIQHRFHLINSVIIRDLDLHEWMQNICRAGNFISQNTVFQEYLLVKYPALGEFGRLLWARATLGRFSTSLGACFLLASKVTRFTFHIELINYLRRFPSLCQQSRYKMNFFLALQDPMTSFYLDMFSLYFRCIMYPIQRVVYGQGTMTSTDMKVGILRKLICSLTQNIFLLLRDEKKLDIILSGKKTIFGTVVEVKTGYQLHKKKFGFYYTTPKTPVFTYDLLVDENKLESLLPEGVVRYGISKYYGERGLKNKIIKPPCTSSKKEFLTGLVRHTGCGLYREYKKFCVSSKFDDIPAPLPLGPGVLEGVNARMKRYLAGCGNSNVRDAFLRAVLISKEQHLEPSPDLYTQIITEYISSIVTKYQESSKDRKHRISREKLDHLVAKRAKRIITDDKRKKRRERDAEIGRLYNYDSSWSKESLCIQARIRGLTLFSKLKKNELFSVITKFDQKQNFGDLEKDFLSRGIDIPSKASVEKCITILSKYDTGISSRIPSLKSVFAYLSDNQPYSINDFWLGEAATVPSGDPLEWKIKYLGTSEDNKISATYFPAWDCHGSVKYQKEMPVDTEGRSAGVGDMGSCLFGPVLLSRTRVSGKLDDKSKSEIRRLMRKVISQQKEAGDN